MGILSQTRISPSLTRSFVICFYTLSGANTRPIYTLDSLSLSLISIGTLTKHEYITLTLEQVFYLLV